jgi:SAM-dependent methyltransferase
MLEQAVSSNETYNRDFSDYYDRITKHKDYQGEIDALVRFMRQEVSHPSPRVLDVGCGTGSHAALMAEKGYDVTAIDLSPDMIRIAASKSAAVKFKSGDVAEMPESGFHFCYSLFNVINCLDTIASLTTFFQAVAARLAPGGLFLVESWNPIAVIAAPPEVVERTYEYEDERIVRKVTPAPDFLHQRLDLRYDVDVYGTGDRQEKLKSFTVVHQLVLFTPLEIEYCLGRAGFGDVKIQTALPELAEATATDRMLAFTARKI